MKHILTLFLFLGMTLGMSAQQHLKFMGIPLDGTINNFQQQLQAKGMTPDAESNRILGVGIRAFKGRFSGYDAMVAIFYDERTKKVYKAKVIIEASTSDMCEQYYEDLKGNLIRKYGEGKTETKNGHEGVIFAVFPPEDDTICGLIGLAVSKSESYPYVHTVDVEYYNGINYLEHEDNKMDDL